MNDDTTTNTEDALDEFMTSETMSAEEHDALYKKLSELSDNDLTARHRELTTAAGDDPNAMTYRQLVEVTSIFRILRSRKTGPAAQKKKKENNLSLSDLGFA